MFLKNAVGRKETSGKKFCDHHCGTGASHQCFQKGVRSEERLVNGMFNTAHHDACGWFLSLRSLHLHHGYVISHRESNRFLEE
jgi:hypothetical protein